MSVEVDFECTGCGRMLRSACPLQAAVLWPKSYRWSCRGCGEGCRYILFLRLHRFCYSVCRCAPDWQVLPGSTPVDAAFRTPLGPPREPIPCNVRLEWFLQQHAAAAAHVVPRMLASLQPVDEVAASVLRAELTASTRHGALADFQQVGFADAGARAGYIKERLSSRSCQLGALLAAEPLASLLFQRAAPAAGGQRLRMASLGGGPGEGTLALALCRALLGADAAARLHLEVALLDLEVGWAPCAEILGRELQSLSLLHIGMDADDVRFGEADVTLPLSNAANKALLPASTWDIVLFSYVLVENAQSLHAGGYCLLKDLFSGLKLGACCIIVDSSTKLQQDIECLGDGCGMRALHLAKSARPSCGAMPRNCLVLVKH